MTPALLMMVWYVNVGYLPSLTYFKDLPTCEAYKTRKESYNGGRYNGQVLRAEFYCLMVPSPVGVPR